MPAGREGSVVTGSEPIAAHDPGAVDVSGPGPGPGAAAADAGGAGARDPDSGGRSTTRRERRRQAERKRRMLLVIPSVAVVVFGAFFVGLVVRDSGSDDTPTPSADAGAGAVAAGADTLLLEHRAADGRADLLVVVGPGSAGSASVLLVPAGTLSDVPSLGIQALADVPTLGEAGLLTTTVENLLGVEISSTATVDAAALTAALQPAAPIPVDLRHEVEITTPGAEAIIPAGSQSLSAEDAARVLTAAESGGEIEHLVTVQAVLEGWMTRLRDDAVADATLAVRPDLAALVDAADRPVRVGSLPVDSLATPGGDRFEVRTDDLDKYVRRAFPGALLGIDGRRPRVEILNGTGGVGVTQGAARLVVPAGGRVALTGNVPGFDVTDTQVVYYRDRDRAAAQRLLDALGCGSLRRANQPIDVVDVTVIIGADCPDI
jgi:LytR cell envelope-related transcriptional attenuator